jgi:hypothetical protein
LLTYWCFLLFVVFGSSADQFLIFLFLLGVFFLGLGLYVWGCLLFLCRLLFFVVSFELPSLHLVHGSLFLNIILAIYKNLSLLLWVHVIILKNFDLTTLVISPPAMVSEQRNQCLWGRRGCEKKNWRERKKYIKYRHSIIKLFIQWLTLLSHGGRPTDLVHARRGLVDGLKEKNKSKHYINIT